MQNLKEIKEIYDLPHFSQACITDRSLTIKNKCLNFANLKSWKLNFEDMDDGYVNV